MPSAALEGATASPHQATVLEVKGAPQQHQIITAMRMDDRQVLKKLEDARRRFGDSAVLVSPLHSGETPEQLLVPRSLPAPRDAVQPGKKSWACPMHGARALEALRAQRATSSRRLPFPWDRRP